MTNEALLPGSTLGILGGGQLGKMIGMEARRMGYRVAIMDPSPACAARPISDVFVEGAFDDVKAATALAEQADVVTVETEHIPSEVLVEVEGVKRVSPVPLVLHTIQDRLRQKEFLTSNGFPNPAFHAVTSADDLEAAVAFVGTPAVMKSRRGGYDGKGQSRLSAPEDARAAWDAIGNAPAILEAYVPFRKEVSVVLARATNGDVTFYPVVENEHRNGVLHVTHAPAVVSEAVRGRAQSIASGIAEALDHHGTMAVEMFLTEDDDLLVNEIAPRVHNSGHFTLDACVTSQFEQHLRAVVGLPLGDPTLLRPAVMVNLLGDLWGNGEPDWRVILDEPHAHLHLYGKTPAKPGRKMGHFVVLHEDADAAMRIATRLYDTLAAQAGSA